MLYSLIPPILIILSLIGIILMLLKKTKQLSELPPEELTVETASERAGAAGRFGGRLRSVKGEDVKHFFLAILEKITRKSRMIFLKLEALFAGWSNSIRSQRQARTQRKMQAGPTVRENDILQKLNSYQLDKKNKLTVKTEEKATAESITMNQSETARRSKKMMMSKKTASGEVLSRNFPKDEEQTIRPIISEKIITPRPRAEIKDRLEELLIERIAVNPKDIEAYERLGEYYLEIKSYPDAKECFKQVLKLNPADRNAKYRMRRLENLLAKE